MTPVAHPAFDPAYVAAAARVLGLLSHPTRLHIVLLLTQGPATVSQLCEGLGLAQSNASHHLGILRNTGLVKDEREGQWVVYRIRIEAWRRIADGFFDSLLSGQNTVTLQNFRVTRLAEPRKQASSPPPSQ